MRYMILVKATHESEAGAMPEAGLIEMMAAYQQTTA